MEGMHITAGKKITRNVDRRIFGRVRGRDKHARLLFVFLIDTTPTQKCREGNNETIQSVQPSRNNKNEHRKHTIHHPVSAIIHILSTLLVLVPLSFFFLLCPPHKHFRCPAAVLRESAVAQIVRDHSFRRSHFSYTLHAHTHTTSPNSGHDF